MSYRCAIKHKLENFSSQQKKKTLPLESSGKTKTNKKCHTTHSCRRATFKWETFTTSLFATVTHPHKQASAARSTSWSRSFVPRNRASTVRQVQQDLLRHSGQETWTLLGRSARRNRWEINQTRKDKPCFDTFRWWVVVFFFWVPFPRVFGDFFEFWTKKKKEIKQTTIAFFRSWADSRTSSWSPPSSSVRNSRERCYKLRWHKTEWSSAFCVCVCGCCWRLSIPTNPLAWAGGNKLSNFGQILVDWG